METCFHWIFWLVLLEELPNPIRSLMKKLLQRLVILSCLFFLPNAIPDARAQGTAFTYQGQLSGAGGPVSGVYDFQFAVFDAIGGGTQIGSTIITNAVGVTNGLFMVTLDFGINVFTGNGRWLDLAAHTNNSPAAFVSMTPRQALTPAPYSVFAGTASNLSGTLLNSSLPVNPIFSGTIKAGSFSGNGIGLTNLNSTQLAGGAIPTAVLPGFQSPNYDTVGGGQGNNATSQYSTVAGGFNNEAVNSGDFVGGGGTDEPSGNAAQGGNSVVVGGSANTAGGFESFIGGGYGNGTSGDGAFVGGGGSNVGGNHANGNGSVVVGGELNTASGAGAFIGGGGFDGTFLTASGNFASGGASVIAGGLGNTATANEAAVGGGMNNQATNIAATVPGGRNNIAGGQYSFAAGFNARATNNGAFVWADSQNAAFTSTNNDSFNVRAQGGVQFVTGGAGVTVDGVPIFSEGVISPSALPNFQISDLYETIGGGLDNGTSGGESVVGGGVNNHANGDEATVGGGGGNGASGQNATVAGGFNNHANYYYATVGGGDFNQATNSYSTIPGGANNLAGGSYSFAAGQRAKAINDGAFVWADSQVGDFTSTANNEFSVRAQNGVRIQANKGIHLDAADEPIIVRDWNPFSTNAPANKAGIGRWGLFMEPTYLTIGIPDTNGIGDTVPRYFQIAKYSTNGAYASLVVVDESGSLFASNNVYAKGVQLTSDRNAKENFTPLDTQAILAKVAAMPVTEWNYKNDGVDTRHIGPVAQDFQAAFKLDGADDKHISVVDEGGVALAAIQGLNQKLEGKDAVIQQQAGEISELKTRLDALEKMVRNQK